MITETGRYCFLYKITGVYHSIDNAGYDPVAFQQLLKNGRVTLPAPRHKRLFIGY